jgi:membrane protease YdiL (CAAX protease family)
VSTGVTPEVPPAPPSGPARRPRRGWPLLAWLVIVSGVGFTFVRHYRHPPQADPAVRLVTSQIQARYLVGLRHLGVLGGGGRQLYEQARESFPRSSYAQRLRFVVVAGELAGPKAARAELDQLEEDVRDGRVEEPADGAKLRRLLKRLYAGGKLSAGERRELRAWLGWFGELALTPAGSDEEARERVLAPARRSAWVIILQFLGLLGGAFVGVVILLVLLVLGLLRRLRGGLRPGGGHGGLYAETFALYMVLFFVLGWAASWIPAGRFRLLVQGAVMVLSLAALGWPVLWGVPWRQVRQEVGWLPGRRGWLEPLFGVLGYVATLPLVLGALIVTIILILLGKHLGWGSDPLSPGNDPSHPVIGLALHADVWTWVQILLVAAVLAPLVEETMFRGVLYRHLRDARARWGWAVSVLFGALASGFVFAIVHPQGVLGVPVLMALAIGFALVREWRETLVPPMVAHGINNAVITGVLYLLTR